MSVHLEMSDHIVSEWYNLTDCIYWSIPRGQYFFRKYAKILPWSEPQPLDKSSSRALTTIAPYHKSKPVGYASGSPMDHS